MTKKPLSTFDREMKNATFRKKFEKAYQEFLLKEAAQPKNPTQCTLLLAALRCAKKFDTNTEMYQDHPIKAAMKQYI